MKKDDLLVITRIRDLCDGITRLPNGDYDRDSYIQTSLSRIGVLAANLSDKFKDATRNKIKWGFVRALSGMTGVCGEQTFREISEGDIPVLQDFCERAIEKHYEEKRRKRSKSDFNR